MQSLQATPQNGIAWAEALAQHLEAVSTRLNARLRANCASPKDFHELRQGFPGTVRLKPYQDRCAKHCGLALRVSPTFTPSRSDYTSTAFYLEIFTYNLDMTSPSAFQALQLRKRTRIPMRTIHALANHIAEKFNPEEIILFGSHAYGKPDASSDVDLLVVMETPKGEVKTIMEISDSLPPLPFRVDVIARSRTVIDKRKNSGDFFLREITKRGKVLYARGH